MDILKIYLFFYAIVYLSSCLYIFLPTHIIGECSLPFELVHIYISVCARAHVCICVCVCFKIKYI